MEKSPRPPELESTIREIIHELLEMPVTPHIRELRAKAVTYGRVIGNWAVYAPTVPQVQAMLECVNELQEKVHAAKESDVSRITRRPAQSASTRKTSIPPPGVAWNANVTDSGSRPPSPLSSPTAPTVPPVSAKRPLETPTPAPALLRSRRSR